MRPNFVSIIKKEINNRRVINQRHDLTLYIFFSFYIIFFTRESIRPNRVKYKCGSTQKDTSADHGPSLLVISFGPCGPCVPILFVRQTICVSSDTDINWNPPLRARHTILNSTVFGVSFTLFIILSESYNSPF